MSSRKRQQAIASGRIVENAEAVRRRRREEAAIVREELAIQLYAQGKRTTDIEDELFDKTGARCHGQIKELIRRGLYRRVQANKANVEQAKEMLLTEYRALAEVYMPRALGGLRDPETGLELAPDLRAAEFMLRLLDKVGQVTGAMTPPRSGDINLNVLMGAPADAETARRQALEAIERERAKLHEIEGQLADTPAVAGGPTGEDIPPPFDLPATPA